MFIPHGIKYVEMIQKQSAEQSVTSGIIHVSIENHKLKLGMVTPLYKKYATVNIHLKMSMCYEHMWKLTYTKGVLVKETTSNLYLSQ